MSELAVEFSAGSLVFRNWRPECIAEAWRSRVIYDERIDAWRARAIDYGPLLLELRAAGIDIEDRARAFAPLDIELRSAFPPRDYQLQAMEQWKQTGFRGIVALPTGSGKTFVAALAIARLRRPALVCAPTIDLVQQWASSLERWFRQPVGMLGGGSHEVRDITVSTYDSAVLQMEFIGNRFGLLICDECHHLPGPVNALAAQQCLAPYRLGLTATPEVGEERQALLFELLGPLCCQIHIDELAGSVLAPYRTETVSLNLDSDEQEAYQEQRKIYTDFVRSQGIDFRQPDGWRTFLIRCASCGRLGRAAFDAFLAQRELARNGRNKLKTVWQLLLQHPEERILIFTAANAQAYQIGREFVLPVLTHHTRLAERKAMLDSFRSGEFPVLVTSKVLNEGVDVPEANIGIVVSGSSTTREHVQRLGRILRATPGKQAILYELVNTDTNEIYASRKRQSHRAWQ